MTRVTAAVWCRESVCVQRRVSNCRVARLPARAADKDTGMTRVYFWVKECVVSQGEWRKSSNPRERRRRVLCSTGEVQEVQTLQIKESSLVQECRVGIFIGYRALHYEQTRRSPTNRNRLYLQLFVAMTCTTAKRVTQSRPLMGLRSACITMFIDLSTVPPGARYAGTREALRRGEQLATHLKHDHLHAILADQLYR